MNGICRNFFVLTLCVLPVAAFAAKEPAGDEDKEPAPIVFVDKVKTSELFDVLSYPARLIPKTTATLLSEADGIVRKISTPLGTPVKKNETVATIGNTDPVYQYAPMSVRSPVAGVVSSVEITEGSRVTRGQRLLTITDPTKIKIQVEIAAADLPTFKPGLIGKLTVPSQDGESTVKVVGISPFVDPATGTATAELLPDGKSKMALPPGLIGRVTFRAHDHSGIQIPESAVIYRGQSTVVRVVEKGKARYVPVTLGATRRGLIEVLKGLGAGTQVIVRASAFIAEGEKVEVQGLEAPES